MNKIRVGGVPEHFNYPWKKCIEESKFEALGLDVSWTDFGGGTGEMSEALDAGKIDVAVMLTEGSMKQINDGKAFTILQKFIDTPLLWGIFVDANSRYQKTSELENKTAAISRFGSGSHLMAYVNADRKNWPTDELNFEITKNLDGAVKALSNQSADYFMWEHFTTQPLVDQGVFRRLDDCPTPWPCFVVVTSEQFKKTHQKQLELLLETVNKSTETLKKLPKIDEQIAAAYQLKLSEVQKWLALTEWSQEQITDEEIESTLSELKRLSLVNADLKASQIKK
ncbi:MAG: substrate-binding domain-containing protein [Bacteroidota bacterium]